MFLIWKLRKIPKSLRYLYSVGRFNQDLFAMKLVAKHDFIWSNATAIVKSFTQLSFLILGFTVTNLKKGKNCDFQLNTLYDYISIINLNFILKYIYKNIQEIERAYLRFSKYCKSSNRNWPLREVYPIRGRTI